MPECGRPRVAKGVCQAHGRRLRLYGDVRADQPIQSRSGGRCPQPWEDRYYSKIGMGPVPAARPDLGPCHLWTASRTRKGYGRFERPPIGGRSRTAHAVPWEAEHGPVPDGRVLDHLCQVTLCVRQSHLELVTWAENIRRRNGNWTGENRQAARLRTHDQSKTSGSCPHGHDLAVEGVYLNKKGGASCKRCVKDRALARDRANREQAPERLRRSRARRKAAS